MVEERPEVIGRLVEGGTPTPLARALVVVGAASNSLGRVWLVDDDRVDVLEALDAPVDIDGTDPDALGEAKRLELPAGAQPRTCWAWTRSRPWVMPSPRSPAMCWRAR